MRDRHATLERVRDVAGSAVPPADSLARFERYRSRRQRRQRLTAGLGALLVVAAGATILVRALGGAPDPRQTVPAQEPPLTGDPRITTEIPLPEEAVEGTIYGGVAIGAGSAWVGVASGKPDQVLRIDLATNEVVAEIPVGETPWREHIAATDDAVWIAHTHVIERIDTATNTVAATIELRGRFVSAIAADGAALWVVAIDDRSDEGAPSTGTLLRIDPGTNEVVAEIPLGRHVSGYQDQVRLGAGTVWVLGVRLEGEDVEHGGQLIRIDPVSNEVAARIPVAGFHMAVGTDEVWVRGLADGSSNAGERWLWTRVNVRTNEPSEPFELETTGLRLVSPEALWSVDYDHQENVRVSRFDPKTLSLEARSAPIGTLFHDAVFDARSGTVWISAVHSIVRVDIA